MSLTASRLAVTPIQIWKLKSTAYIRTEAAIIQLTGAVVLHLTLYFTHTVRKLHDQVRTYLPTLDTHSHSPKTTRVKLHGESRVVFYQPCATLSVDMRESYPAHLGLKDGLSSRPLFPPSTTAEASPLTRGAGAGRHQTLGDTPAFKTQVTSTTPPLLLSFFSLRPHLLLFIFSFRKRRAFFFISLSLGWA